MSSRSSFTPSEDAAAEPSPESAQGANRPPSKNSSTAGGAGAAARIRRRNRMITSCLECRRRKLKCDRMHPCSNCSKASNRDCVFLAPSMDSATRLKLTELKERMGTLERSLEKEVGSKGESIADDAPNLYEGVEPPSSTRLNPEFTLHDERELEPTALAVQDAAYEDEADDDMTDLGFRVGRMALTERLGGFFRPKLTEELIYTFEHGGRQPNATSLDRILVPDFDDPKNATVPQPTWHGPTFILPRSDMFFGMSVQDFTLLDCLPSRPAADRLIQQYWEAVHPIVRITHRPSLETRYEKFWNCISAGIEPLPSNQAIIFAALFSAVVSMSERDVLDTFGTTQQALMEKFQTGTEAALSKARFLRTTKVETLQALIMYLLPMCRDTISRAHSTIVGAAIRLAECMGLHRDPSEYGLPPVETHVRRLIWHQLCYLDLRTSELQGPRVFIRREDYTTKFPLNTDDQALVTGPWEDKDKWTDMTFTCVRFQCQDMMRQVFKERLLLEKKAITLTQILGKVEAFRKEMQAKYEPLFGGSHPMPIQRQAAAVMSLFINKMYIAILHRYHSGVMVRIPDRLRQVILTTGTQLLEDAVEIETNPLLRPWAWYSAGYQQWHVAMLLLVEIYAHPMRREADRIWRCLDYTYETPPLPDRQGREHLPVTRQELVTHRAEKCRLILSRLIDKLGSYSAMRRMRAPAAMTSSTAAAYISSQVAGKPPPTRGIMNDSDLMGTGYRSGSDSSAAARKDGIGMYRRDESYSLSPESSASTSSPRPDTTQPPFFTFLPTQETWKRAHDPASLQALQRERERSESSNRSVIEKLVSISHVDQNVSANNVGLSNLSAPPSASFSASSGSNMGAALPMSTDPEELRRLIHDDSSSFDATATSSRFYVNPTGMGMHNIGMQSIDVIPTAAAGYSKAAQDNPIASSQEDEPMLDIDWGEWDKLFPPHINDGNINLPF